MAANQNINAGTFIAIGRPIVTHHGRPLAERTEHGKFKTFFGASAEVCFVIELHKNQESAFLNSGAIT